MLQKGTGKATQQHRWVQTVTDPALSLPHPQQRLRCSEVQYGSHRH